MRNGTKTMMNILFAVATEINYGIFKIFVKLLVFKKIQQDCRYIKKIINVKIIKKAILFKRQIRICTYFSWSILTLFRMGFFGATHGWGGGQKGPPSLKPVTHILKGWNWHSDTLPKEDPKNIWITCHTSWVMLTSAFFHWKSANFPISRNADIDCILIHNVYLF